MHGPPMNPIKSAVKRVLARYPYALRESRLFHQIERVRAYRNVRLRPELTDRADLLAELDREGIVVLPGYFSKDVARSWLAEVDSVVAKMRAGKLSRYVQQVRGFDFCRISYASSLVPATASFFSDAMLSG